MPRKPRVQSELEAEGRKRKVEAVKPAQSSQPPGKSASQCIIGDSFLVGISPVYFQRPQHELKEHLWQIQARKLGSIKRWSLAVTRTRRCNVKMLQHAIVEGMHINKMVDLSLSCEMGACSRCFSYSPIIVSWLLLRLCEMLMIVYVTLA